MIKKIISKFNDLYAIYCPQCHSELNWYASSTNSDTLKCLKCSLYFDKESNCKTLVETDVPNQYNAKFFQNDKYHHFYQGTPTSEFYRPKWLRIVLKLISRRG